MDASLRTFHADKPTQRKEQMKKLPKKVYVRREFEGDASLNQAPLRLSAMDALAILKRETGDWLRHSRLRRSTGR